MADPTYTTYSGTGEVVTADFKNVKWVGETKGKKAIEIALSDALSRDNIDLTMADKDDIVAALTFEASYSNTDATSSSTAEPWTVKIEDTPSAGASEIVLGNGIFYIGSTAVALCRGGGKFTVERDYREQNADGDRGMVKGRVVLQGSRAKLSMNMLTWLTNITNIWPAVAAQS